MLDGGLRQQRRALRVRLPRGCTAFRRLRFVDGGVGAGVDDRTVQAPVDLRVGGGIREIEFVDVGEFEPFQPVCLHIVADRAAELSIRAGHQRATRRHRLRVLEHRMVQVGLTAFRFLERNRPLDIEVRVSQIDERVGLLLLERPVRVHQIRIRRAVFERLEAVADAARHVDRARRIQTRCIHLAERVARAQIDPCAEDLAGGERDELVPRLGVDAARHTFLRVEADVVLHRLKIGRQSKRRHLRLLPVLFEPAAVVAVHRQVEDEQSGDVRFGDLEFLFKFHRIVSLPL